MLDASGSALALLAPSQKGTLSLVFGSQAGELARAMGYFGGDVVVAEVASELVDAPHASETTFPSRRIRIGDPRQLPFSDSSVDNVFLTSGLGWVSGITADIDGAEVVQTRLLAECQRILKPSGQLVLATPNRLGLSVWSGRRDPLTGLRWVGLMPRAVAGAVSRLLRRKPYRERLHTWRGYADRLERANFTAVTCHVPWPRADRWEYVILDAIGNTAADFSVRSAGWRWGLAAGLVRSLRRLGLHSVVFPDLIIVCAKRERPDSGVSPGQARTLLARVLEREGIHTLSNLLLRYRASTEAFLLETPTLFLKIPLSLHGVERQEAEIRALRRLSETELARHTLQAARMENVAGVRYSVYPRVPHAAASQSSDGRRVEQALDLLFRDAEERRLRDTATWSRIFSEPSLSRFRSSGSAAVVRELESRLAVKRVPTGMVHGDLKYGNLLDRNGDLTIIDWDRFEEPAPLLLDGMHALFHEAMRQERGVRDPQQRYLAALERLLQRPAGSLADRVQSVIGELDWAEAVMLYIVSYQQYWLDLAPLSATKAEVEQAVRLRLELCERAWQRA